MQKTWAQCGMAAPATDAAKSADHGGLTPDTLLVKLQAEPNQPPIELTLKQFMQKYNIPGLSVAIIDNYKVAWAGGFGVTAPGGTEPVTNLDAVSGGIDFKTCCRGGCDVAGGARQAIAG